MSGIALIVSSTLLGLGTILDLGATQNNLERSFSLDANVTTIAANNGAPPDQVAVLYSADNFVTDSAFLGYVSSADGIKNLRGVGRYVRTVRLVINNAASPSCVSFVNDLVPAANIGGLGVVANGGQALGINWVVGPSDAFSLSLVANAVVGYLQTSGGTLTLGTTTGASSTRVQSGTGGIGIGIAAPGTSGTNVDTPVAASLFLGATNATVVTAGNNAATTSLLGSTLQIGASGSTTTIQGQTINMNAAANVAATNIATGAAVQTLIAGSTNTTSVTTVNAGTPGVRIGAALLLTAPVAIADGTGSLGTAATTVDISSRLVVTQTTPVITQGAMRLLQVPTSATAGRLCCVENATGSTASFTVGDVALKQGVNLNPGMSCWFEYDGAAWIVLSNPTQDPIQGADLTNADVTSLRAGLVTEYTLPAGTLSANHTNTPPTTGARKGDVLIITRLDVTANTYAVIGVTTFTMPASKVNFSVFRYNGTGWQFVSGGTQ